MHRAIRLTVCLVLASASTPVFAGTDDVPTMADDDMTATDTARGDADVKSGDGYDAGAGSREPAPMEPRTIAGDTARDSAQQQFLQTVWAPNP